MDAFTSTIFCHQCGFVEGSDYHDASRPHTCATKATKKIQSLEEREFIFRQGDEASGIYNLISGLVLIVTEDAKGGVVGPRLITPGNAFGYRSSLEGGTHAASALVLQDCCYCQIPQANAKRLMENNRDVRRAMVNRCTQDLRDAREEMMMYASVNLPERLLHFLLKKMLGLFGAVRPDGAGEIGLPMKRGELAMALGVKGETLSRAIQKLKTDDLAVFDGRRVFIPSVEKAEHHIDMALSPSQV